jgi:hypothetical protein
VALTKVNRGGLNTGISDSSDATFLTATSSEGVTLAGTLAVTGVHTVGNNAIYTSDGGAATLNLVQGLAKAWAQIDGTSAAHIDDSFNCGGITDNGTGDYSTAITSAFSNVSNIVAVGMEHVNSTSSAVDIANSSTSSMRLKSFDGGSASDREHLGFLVHGDLA